MNKPAKHKPGTPVKHNPGANLGKYLHPAKGGKPAAARPMPVNRMMPQPIPGPTPPSTPNPYAKGGR